MKVVFYKADTPEYENPFLVSEEHPQLHKNCRCSIVTLPSGMKEYQTNGDACAKCRKQAQDFNRAEQERFAEQEAEVQKGILDWVKQNIAGVKPTPQPINTEDPHVYHTEPHYKTGQRSLVYLPGDHHNRFEVVTFKYPGQNNLHHTFVHPVDIQNRPLYQGTHVPSFWEGAMPHTQAVSHLTDGADTTLSDQLRHYTDVKANQQLNHQNTLLRPAGASQVPNGRDTLLRGSQEAKPLPRVNTFQREINDVGNRYKSEKPLPQVQNQYVGKSIVFRRPVTLLKAVVIDTPALTGEYHNEAMVPHFTSHWRENPGTNTGGDVTEKKDGRVGNEIGLTFLDKYPNAHTVFAVDPRVQRRHIVLGEGDELPVKDGEYDEWTGKEEEDPVFRPLVFKRLLSEHPELKGQSVPHPLYDGASLPITEIMPNTQTRDENGKPTGHISEKLLEDLAKHGEHGKDWYEDQSNLLYQHGETPEEGERYARGFGITGHNTPVDQNYGNSMKFWNRGRIGLFDNEEDHDFARENGLIAPLSIANPSGHALSRAWNNKDLPFSNTKLMDYTAPLVKRVGAAMDEWMNRLFSNKNDVPRDRQYDYMRGRVAGLARKLGWSENQTQAALWVGYKRYINDYAHNVADKLAKSDDPEIRAYAPKLRLYAQKIQKEGQAKDVMGKFGRLIKDSSGNIKGVLPPPEFRNTNILAKHFNTFKGLINDGAVGLKKSGFFPIESGEDELKSVLEAHPELNKNVAIGDLVKGKSPLRVIEASTPDKAKIDKILASSGTSGGQNPYKNIKVGNKVDWDYYPQVHDEDKLKSLIKDEHGNATEFGKDMAEAFRVLNTATEHRNTAGKITNKEREMEDLATSIAEANPQLSEEELDAEALKHPKYIKLAREHAQLQQKPYEPTATYAAEEKARLFNHVAKLAYDNLPEHQHEPVQLIEGGEYYVPPRDVKTKPTGRSKEFIRSKAIGGGVSHTIAFQRRRGESDDDVS